MDPILQRLPGRIREGDVNVSSWLIFWFSFICLDAIQRKCSGDGGRERRRRCRRGYARKDHVHIARAWDTRVKEVGDGVHRHRMVVARCLFREYGQAEPLCLARVAQNKARGAPT